MKLMEEVKPVETEIVDVLESNGRILAEDARAKIDVPPYDISAVDGYAVHSSDVIDASEFNPATLKVIGASYAGNPYHGKLKTGEAVKIATGGVIPEGADSVVMVEYTSLDNGNVLIYRPTTPGINISRRGRVIKGGEIILEAGHKVKPWHVGLMSSSGLKSVKVYRKPKVKVFSVGDEIVESLEDLKPGYVLDSNRAMVISLLKHLGVEVTDSGVLPDDVDRVCREIEEGNYDVTLSLAGTSVGERDIVPEAVKRLGKIVFHGISVRPGKPVLAGMIDGKIHIGLPGLPVALLIGYAEIVITVIRKLMGYSFDWKPITLQGVLSDRVSSPPGVRSYVRVKVKLKGDVRIIQPISSSGSDLLTSVTRAQGIVIVPEMIEGYEAGQKVEYIPLDEFLGVHVE